MIEYMPVRTEQDLLGILELQQRNLAKNLSREEIDKEGFVTVSHTLDILKKMHAIEPSIIAIDQQKVIGYVLAMTVHSKTDFPILVPMFEMFEHIQFKGRPVSSYNYLIIGQICIEKKYRGKGIFQKLYDVYRKQFQSKYDFVITEIATKNHRSMHAHQRIGFFTAHEYTAPDGMQWRIVLQDWSALHS